MELKLIEKNGETILAICLFGANRNSENLEWHKKVMVGKFGLNINYVKAPFEQGVSHGGIVNLIISQTIDTIKPDYFFFIDNDALILKKECFDIMYDFVKNKITVAGQFWQSNHKSGPNGMIPHPYISQAFIMFSRELYNLLGKPDCDHFIPRSDTMEEITYQAKFRGYAIAGFYPSHAVESNTDLDNGCRFGLGTTFGPNMCYHASQQNNPRSTPLFIEKCKEVLDGMFD